MPVSYLMMIVDDTVQEEGCDKTSKEGQEKSTDRTKTGEEMRQDGGRREKYSAAVIDGMKRNSTTHQLHFNINIKSDKTKVKQCRRDFRRGDYEEIRNSLARIDWNDKMNIKLRMELDRAIDSYVPMKKQGKRSKKKHLSKEAFRKIRYKQNVWRVYKHTGTDKDYDAYKEALNAATNEVRKSKRNVEHKLAQNIK